MSNNLFNRLNKPRITKYAPTLVGQTIPYRTKENTSITGNYIDQLVKTWAGVSTGLNTIVDLMIYGIEIKSKDIITNSDWSIGSMRLVDIINTPYEQSSVYQKLQALFLVEYNNDLCSITSANLYYLDNDCAYVAVVAQLDVVASTAYVAVVAQLDVVAVVTKVAVLNDCAYVAVTA